MKRLRPQTKADLTECTNCISSGVGAEGSKAKGFGQDRSGIIDLDMMASGKKFLIFSVKVSFIDEVGFTNEFA